MKKIIGYLVIALMFAGSICGVTYGIKYAVLQSKTDADYTQELENKVSEYQNQMNTYYLTILDLQSQINDLKLQGTTDSATIFSLEATITSLNSTVEALSATNTANEETIAQNEETIANLEKQVAVLESESEDKSSEITTLNNTISSLKTQNESLQSTNESNLALITSLNGQIVTLNEQIATLSTQITGNTDTVTKLNTEIAQLQKTISTYETYIASLETNEQAAVTFIYNGYVYGIQIVTKGSTASIGDPPSSDYIKFNGWTINGTDIVNLSEETITTNTTFTADVTYLYDVTFIADNETIDTQIVESGAYATAPTDPTLDGYEFDGWTVDGVSVVSLSEYQITSTTTFIAKFTALHTVVFTYDTETISTQSIRDGSCATAPSVESTEYMQFNGWLLNGESVVVSDYPVVADLVFTADITYSYAVTFISNDVTIDTQIVESGTYATAPTDPTLDGYAFDGWTINGTDIVDVDNYEITHTTTFTAKFSLSYTYLQNNEQVISAVATKLGIDSEDIISTAYSPDGDLYSVSVQNGEDVEVYLLLLSEDVTEETSVNDFCSIVETSSTSYSCQDFETYTYDGYPVVGYTMKESTYTNKLEEYGASKFYCYYYTDGATYYVYFVAVNENNEVIQIDLGTAVNDSGHEERWDVALVAVFIEDGSAWSIFTGITVLYKV